MDITERIPSRISQIKKYKAGSTVDDYIKKYGIDKDSLIRLSSNENPYGPSPLIAEKLRSITDKLNLYPETDYRAIKKTFAERVNVEYENVTVGNGSDELFLLCSLVFGDEKEAIIPEPSFTWYRTCLLLSNATQITLPILEDKNFVLTSEEIINAVTKNTTLLFLASPNNPTGYRMPYNELEKVAIECENQCIVIDEAYYDFCNDRSAVDLIEYENVVVTRTMSKAYALAGVRVGFLVAHKKIISILEKIKPPFNINSVGIVATKTALEDQQFFSATVDKIKSERTRVFNSLSSFHGIKVYPSDANFLFMKITKEGLNSEKVFLKLLKRGILVRNCSSFDLCNDNYIRVTTGTSEENDAFLHALQSILKE